MSIRLMNLVWERELPQSRKFLLLALADQANDTGEAWPSVSTLAARCSMGRRTVFEALAELEGEGWLQRVQMPGQRVKYQLNVLKLQQLPLQAVAGDGCEIRTSAKSAPVRNPHQCTNRTGADFAETGAKSALLRATKSNRGGGCARARTREAELQALPPFDAGVIEPFLGDLPECIELQVFADFVKHRQVKGGPLSISAWRQVRRVLLELQVAGVDLNESLRWTMALGLAVPVDPRARPRGGAPPRPRANDDLSQARYDTETPPDDLPPELRAANTGTDG